MVGAELISSRHERAVGLVLGVLVIPLATGCLMDVQGQREHEVVDVQTDPDVLDTSGDIAPDPDAVDTGAEPPEDTVTVDTVVDTTVDLEDVPADEVSDLPACDGPTTIYYIDEDGDGFGWIGGGMEWCAAPPGFVENHDDCMDDSADVNPGQETYFAVDRGDGSFDYDCDLFQSPRWTGTTQCHEWQCDGDGWYGDSVPPCGVTAQWRHCYWEWLWCVVDDNDRTQECR